MRFLDKIRAAVRAAIGGARATKPGGGKAPPGVAFNPPKPSGGGAQSRFPPPGPQTRPKPKPKPTVDPDDDLPFADEIPDDPDANLPLADELTETEAYIFGGGTIHAASSWIEEWKYVGTAKQLYILVKGKAKKARKQYGRVYRLDNVTFKTVMDFYRNDSPGRFFNRFLKGRYTGAKLGTMPTNRGPNVVMTID